MTPVRLLAAVALTAVCISAPAVAQPAGFSAALAASELEAAVPATGPGAAVIVMQRGRLLYAGGRGLANVEADRPVTPDTVFRLGSIAKQFTAAVILQLVAEGRMSLDDPLSRFLPDFPPPGARATVRQLLNHSSGILDYTKIPGWMLSPPSLRPNTTTDLVALMRDRPATAEPGTRWEYNNGGYVLLGAIIEQMTGKPWHEAVVTRIARPLGLTTLAYAGDTPGAAWAHGYSRVNGRYVPARGVHISVAHAAGGLVASVGDLAKWAQALHHGRVVPPALYAEMIRPAHLADGSTEPYGFGLRLRQIRGRPALVHGGAGRGLDSDSVYVPSADLFVAVLANTDDPATDPGTLTRRLAAAALGQPIPRFARVDVPLAMIEPLFGAYGGPTSGAPRRFFARDGKLYVGRGDEEQQVFPAGDDRFSLAGDALTWIRFLRRPGQPPLIEINRLESATPEQMPRIGPVPPPLVVAPELLRSYVGTYATEGPVLTIALDDRGQLTVAPPGQPPLPLRPTSDTEFRVEGAPMRLVFDGPDRLTLYRGARELHGRRTTAP